jgi:hypothetical protein
MPEYFKNTFRNSDLLLMDKLTSWGFYKIDLDLILIKDPGYKHFVFATGGSLNLILRSRRKSLHTKKMTKTGILKI